MAGLFEAAERHGYRQNIEATGVGPSRNPSSDGNKDNRVLVPISCAG